MYINIYIYFCAIRRNNIDKIEGRKKKRNNDLSSGGYPAAIGFCPLNMNANYYFLNTLSILSLSSIFISIMYCISKLYFKLCLTGKNQIHAPILKDAYLLGNPQRPKLVPFF